MKTVILCGGLGTRLREETEFKPKPMVEVGGRPIIWHIMNIFSHHGFREFVLALGYKGEVIKEYFLNYYYHQSDLTVDLGTGEISCAMTNRKRDWTVQLIDTGAASMTGGRLKRLEGQIEETFILTYGDGLANVDVRRLVEFHRSHGKLATVTAVRPAARFGGISFDGPRVVEFKEKPQTGEGWINGGFFVMEPGVFKYIQGEDTVLEADPLERLARDGELMAYKHEGFWQCMDTIRDRDLLEKLWSGGDAPWKVWKD